MRQASRSEANVVPDPEIIKDARARQVLHTVRRLEISEIVVPNPHNPKKPLRSIKIKAESCDALKAAKKLAALIGCKNVASLGKRESGNERFEDTDDSQDEATNQWVPAMGQQLEAVATQQPNVKTSELLEEAEMGRVAQMLKGLMARSPVIEERSQFRPIRGPSEVTEPQRPKRHDPYRRPIRHPY